MLPESSLPELTQFLATPLQLIGLASPDNQQIMASRIGAGIQDAVIRNAWAEFLVGALIIYGVLPRLILTLFTFLMLKLSEYRYKLDLYLPYYVTLRQSLIANEFVASVIDHDPGIVQEQPIRIADDRQIRHFPMEVLAIGIELDNHIIWPKGLVCQENVADQETLMRVVEMIKQSKHPLLMGVAAHRLPDRGVQRIIKKLAALTSSQVWLVLLQNNAAIPVTESRKQAWFQLARACAIPAEQVIS